MQYAPVVLFTYDRADHTKQAVESLLRNAEAQDSDLFIFSDGAKTQEKQQGVDENRAYIHTIDGFKSVTITEREKNWGLANSLIAGITEIVNKYGRVIVVEDDLILSPYFLQFMNDGLTKYADEEKVAAISAFLYPLDCKVPETFLLRDFACWGWATWKRAWRLFNPDARDLLRQLRWRKFEFNMCGSVHAYELLVDQKRGHVDSWAIRFAASLFLANKLVLYPSKSLVVSSGLDGSGVHCGTENRFARMKMLERPVEMHDIKIEENPEMYEEFVRYYRLDNPRNIRFYYKEFKSFIRRILNLDCLLNV